MDRLLQVEIRYNFTALGYLWLELQTNNILNNDKNTVPKLNTRNIVELKLYFITPDQTTVGTLFGFGIHIPLTTMFSVDYFVTLNLWS